MGLTERLERCARLQPKTCGTPALQRKYPCRHAQKSAAARTNNSHPRAIQKLDAVQVSLAGRPVPRRSRSQGSRRRTTFINISVNKQIAPNTLAEVSGGTSSITITNDTSVPTLITIALYTVFISNSDTSLLTKTLRRVGHSLRLGTFSSLTYQTGA